MRLNCVNLKNKDVVDLSKGLGKTLAETGFIISQWQGIHEIENFPTLEDLQNFTSKESKKERESRKEKGRRLMLEALVERIKIRVPWDIEIGQNLISSVKIEETRESFSSPARYSTTTKVRLNENASLEETITTMFSLPFLAQMSRAEDSKTKKHYQELLKELETGEGKKALERVKDFYKNPDSKNLYQKLSPEEEKLQALSELLTLYVSNRIDPKENKLIQLLKELHFKIRNFINKVIFGDIPEVSKLPNFATLGDLADLFGYTNSKLIPPGATVKYQVSTGKIFDTYDAALSYNRSLAETADADFSDIAIQEGITKIPEDVNSFSFFEPNSGERIVINRKEGGNWTMESAFENFFGDLGSTIQITEADALKYYLKEKASDVEFFIRQDLEYAKSRMLIEEYKKQNNIVYNPEEVYSRGGRFISEVGAYSGLDTRLLLQNLILHLQDSQTIGEPYIVSSLVELQGQKEPSIPNYKGVRMVIYPTPENIKWAASMDVNSGMVRDAHHYFNIGLPAEAAGIVKSKYPRLYSLDKITPNLEQAIIEDDSTYSEIAIELTGTNFRLEVNKNSSGELIRLVKEVNKELDKKFGKVVKPTKKYDGTPVPAVQWEEDLPMKRSMLVDKNFQEEFFNKKENFKEEKEKKALANLKMAKIKQVLRKTPDSFITSFLLQDKSSIEKGDSFFVLEREDSASFEDEMIDISREPFLPASSTKFEQVFNDMYAERYIPKEERKAIMSAFKEGLAVSFEKGQYSYTIERDHEGTVIGVIILPSKEGKIRTRQSAYEAAQERAQTLNDLHLPPMMARDSNPGASKVAKVENTPKGTMVRFGMPRHLVVSQFYGVTNSPRHVSPRLLKETLKKQLYERMVAEGFLTDEQALFIKEDQKIQMTPQLTEAEYRDLLNTKVPFAGAVIDGVYLQTLVEYKQALEDRKREEDESISIPNPAVQGVPYRIEVYLEKKREQSKFLEQQINTLKSQRRVKKNKKEYTQRIQFLQNIKDNIDADLDRNVVSNMIEETIGEFFDQDIATAKRLLRQPNFQNIALARNIINFLKDHASTANAMKFSPAEQLVVDAGKSISQEVKEKLAEVTSELNDLEASLNKETRKLLLDLLEEKKEPLLKAFPGMSLEEIRDEFLKRVEYSNLDAYFGNYVLPRGTELETDDLLGKLERLEYGLHESRESQAVKPLIQAIDGVIEKVKNRLKELGNLDFNQVFTRLTENGDLELISRFTPTWGRFLNSVNSVFRETMKEAMADPNNIEHYKIREALNQKWESLSKRADLFDFRELEDVFERGGFIPGGVVEKMRKPASTDRRLELIQLLGEREYNDLVEKQITALHEFEAAYGAIQDDALTKAGVNNRSELSQEEENALKYRLDQINPVVLIENSQQGLGNEVQGEFFSFPHNMGYNIFIPKEVAQNENGQMEDTGFFDQKYDAVLQDPALLEAWEIFDAAVQKYNENFSTNAGLMLNARSIMHMAKVWSESFTDVNWFKKNLFVRPTIAFNNLKEMIKNAFSTSIQTITPTSQISLPDGGIKSFRNVVNKAFETDLAELNAELILSNPGRGGVPFEAKLTKKDVFSLTDMSPDFKERLFTIFDVNDEAEFESKITTIGSKKEFAVGQLRALTQERVLKNQSTDLPRLLKALLEMSAVHNARVQMKETMETITMPFYEQVYGEGTDHNLPAKQAPHRKSREYLKNKGRSFYEMVILNKRKTNDWSWGKKKTGERNLISLSKAAEEAVRKVLGGKNIEDRMTFLGLYLRNLSPEDKRLFEAYKKRMTQIRERLPKIQNNPAHNDLATQMKEELAEMEDKISQMGEDYALGAVAETVGLGLFIFIKLAYNPLAALYNRFQGRQQGVKKAGYIDKNGNLVGPYTLETYDKATAFLSTGFLTKAIDKVVEKTLTTVTGRAADQVASAKTEHGKQLQIMAVFIESLNLIQDGTNFFQRAERIGMTKSPTLLSTKLLTKPMYLTELVEYNNQVPLVLAMLQHEFLEDGVTPVFDGHRFPAHEIVDGKLVLKSEFRTPDNISRWENLGHADTLMFIERAKHVIYERNGDYSTAGAIRFKGHSVGKILMNLTTWLPMLMHNAWHAEQTNLMTGETTEGYLRTLTSNSKMLGFGGQFFLTYGVTNFMMGGMAAAAVAGGLLSVFAGGAILTWLSLISAVNYAARKRAQIKNPGALANPAESNWTVMRGLKLLANTMTIQALETIYNAGSSLLSHATAGAYEHKGLPEMDYTFGGALTEREALAIRKSSKHQALNMLYMYLSMAAIALLGGDDDEKESANSPYYDYQSDKKSKNRRKREAFIGAQNGIQRTYEELNVTVDPQNIFKAFVGDLGSQGQVLYPGGDITTFLGEVMRGKDGDLFGKTGHMYYLDSKRSVYGRRLLPSPVRNIDKPEWKGGFEGMFQYMFVTGSPLLEYDKTDYKRDRKIIEQKRKLAVKEYKARYAELHYPSDMPEKVRRDIEKGSQKNYNFGKLEQRTRDYIEKLIKKEVDREIPYPDRVRLYDENQKRFLKKHPEYPEK